MTLANNILFLMMFTKFDKEAAMIAIVIIRCIHGTQKYSVLPVGKITILQKERRKLIFLNLPITELEDNKKNRKKLLNK